MERLKNYRTFLFLLIAVTLSSVSGKIVTRDENKCHGDNQPVECSWNYLVYFPHRFLSGATENFMVSTHGYPKPVHVNISLYASGKLYTSASKIIQSGQLTKLPVYIGHDAPYSLEPRVSGLGETTADGDAWAFKNTSDVKIAVTKVGNKMYIQSDRPIYKPKQTIKFRVLAIDHQLRPVQGKLDKVVILNPSGSRMRQWNDISLEDGYASFELKTSEKPVLGKWKIEAFMKSYSTSVQVELAKFVLPKFQVTVTPPSYILKTTKTIEAEICAKYSYGKSVNGKVTATICLRKDYSYWSRRNDNEKSNCKTITKKIYGCALISTSLFGEFKSMSRWSNHRVTFKADVKEQATGVELSSKEVEKTISYYAVQLSIESNKKEFKPGFPISIKVSAKAPDGTPVPNIKVEIKAKSSYGENPFFERKVQLTNGMYNLELKAPFTAKSLILEARCSNKDCGEFRQGELTLSPWFSPSNSFVSIEKFKGTAKIGSFVQFKVHYTVVDSAPTDRTIYYSTICAGNIVDSGSFKRTFIGTGVQPTTATTTIMTTKTTNSTNTTEFPFITARRIPFLNRAIPTRPPLPDGFTASSFKFSFDITKEMMPYCRMNVYYMRGQEIVADYTQFDVEDILENPVTMKFSKDEVRPGDSLKLQLQAAPNSKIAITAVDKSIHFLTEGNDIKKDEINRIREQLDVGSTYVKSNWKRCPYRYRKRRSFRPYHGGDDFVDSEQSFAALSLVTLSSLRLDTRPCFQRYYYRRIGLPGAAATTTGLPRLTTTTTQQPGRERK